MQNAKWKMQNADTKELARPDPAALARPFCILTFAF
jgi:hypothetical protein